jgi:hypothetical protein
MIPGYLKTFRQAIRKSGGYEINDINEKSPQATPLNSFNSFNSYSGREKQNDAVAPTRDSPKPDSIGKSVTSPQSPTCAKSTISAKRAPPYQMVFDTLERRCPDLIEPDRWRQAVEDGRRFLAAWGDQAHALGWTAQELFGLCPIPANPRPFFDRLSRYDLTGLIWLLRGRPVVSLTTDSAAIRTVSGGAVVYRKHNKPAVGPLGDSLDDMGPCA